MQINRPTFTQIQRSQPKFQLFLATLLPHGAQTRVKSEIRRADGEVLVVGRTFEEARATRVAVEADLAAGVEVAADVAARRCARASELSRTRAERRALLGRGHRGRRYPPRAKCSRVSQAASV